MIGLGDKAFAAVKTSKVSRLGVDGLLVVVQVGIVCSSSVFLVS